MIKKSPKTKYEKLRNIWYKKLKDDGFNDIEHRDDSLKRWTEDLVSYYDNIDLWRAKETYYQLSDKFLSEHEFKNNLEKTIWEYHANGISVREIAETLKKLKVIKINYWSVWYIVNKLETIMKERYLGK